MVGSAPDSVLDRAIRILEAFTPTETVLTVSEIARRTGLHVATASRLVAALTGHGILAREPDRRVRLGVRLWELALRASPVQSLRDAAMPILEGLHAVVGHHVQLGLLDGDDVLFLERLSAPNSVVNYSRVAGRLPLHASSSGLLLLAHGPDDVLARVLAGPFETFTRATPATAAQVRTELAGIRRDGYAFCRGYVHDDALGIAVPVRDERGAVLAALSVVVPNDPPSARPLVPALRAAAAAITHARTARRNPGAVPPRMHVR